MEPEDLVRRLVTTEDVPFRSITGAPWFAALEASLPRRLSRSFSFLFSHYTFPAFELGPILVFGNSGSGSRWDLAEASRRDAALLNPLTQHGYLQIGRPSTGSYDPVCLAFRAEGKAREIPMVWLDHEALLIYQRAVLVKEVARSFDRFLEQAIEERWRPLAWER